MYMISIIPVPSPDSLNYNTLRDYNQLNKTNYFCSSSCALNQIYFTDKHKKNVELINRFEKLNKNWNDYGAPEISKEVIMLAKTAIYLIRIQPAVFPTGRNSIQFEYEKENGDYLEFEIFENYIMMFSIIANKESEKKIASTELNEMVENFYAGF